MSAVGKYLGLVIASVACGVLVAELLLSIVGYEYTPMTIELAGRSDHRAYHMFEDSHFTYDSGLLWRPKNGFDTFNDQGFRGPTLESVKPADAYRIFAIGDSNTLGWAGSDGANWPQFLTDELEASGRQLTVVNAGVWGYSSFQGVLRFRETLAYDPDMVLISFGSNDAHRVIQSDREFAASPWRMSSAYGGLARYRFGQLVVATLDRFSLREAEPVRPRVTLDEYRANLIEIIQAARSRSIEVVLLTRPYVGDIPSDTWWMNFGRDYNVATAEVAREQRVTLVDVYSVFKDRGTFFADESHFTDEGHHLAARFIADGIRALIKNEK